MGLTLVRVEQILLHAEAEIVRRHRVALTADRAESSWHVVALRRLHKHRVLRVAELLEAADIGHNLRNTDTHLLKVAETEALAICRAHTHIRGIVEHIDVLIAEAHILVTEHEAVAELLDLHVAQLELALEDLKEPPTTLLSLVADAQQKDRLRRILHDELNEGADQNVVALARLVAIQTEVNKCILRKVHLLADHLLGNRREGLIVKAVEQDINGARDTLVLEALLPIGREGEDAISIAVQHIQIHLELGRVDLVDVDPDLEGARDARLADLLEEASDDGHVVVDHHDVGILATDHLRQLREAEALLSLTLLLSLQASRINHIYIGRIAAVVGRRLRILLEAIVNQADPRLLGELEHEVVGHLGIARELLEVGADEHEVDLG